MNKWLNLLFSLAVVVWLGISGFKSISESDDWLGSLMLFVSGMIFTAVLLMFALLYLVEYDNA